MKNLLRLTKSVRSQLKPFFNQNRNAETFNVTFVTSVQDVDSPEEVVEKLARNIDESAEIIEELVDDPDVNITEGIVDDLGVIDEPVVEIEIDYEPEIPTTTTVPATTSSAASTTAPHSSTTVRGRQ